MKFQSSSSHCHVNRTSHSGHVIPNLSVPHVLKPVSVLFSCLGERCSAWAMSSSRVWTQLFVSMKMQNILSSSTMWKPSTSNLCALAQTWPRMYCCETSTGNLGWFFKSVDAGFMTNICPALRDYESVLLKDIVICGRSGKHFILWRCGNENQTITNWGVSRV